MKGVTPAPMVMAQVLILSFNPPSVGIFEVKAKSQNLSTFPGWFLSSVGIRVERHMIVPRACRSHEQANGLGGWFQTVEFSRLS